MELESMHLLKKIQDSLFFCSVDQATRLWSKLSMPPPPRGRSIGSMENHTKSTKYIAKYIYISVPWDLMRFFF